MKRQLILEDGTVFIGKGFGGEMKSQVKLYLKQG